MKTLKIKRNWFKILLSLALASYISFFGYENVSNHYIAIFSASVPFALMALVLKSELNPFVSIRFGKSKIIIKMMRNKRLEISEVSIRELVAHDYDYAKNVYFLETPATTFRLLCNNLRDENGIELNSRELYNYANEIYNLKTEVDGSKISILDRDLAE